MTDDNSVLETAEKIYVQLNVSENDLPYDVACSAHSGTSFVPEERAKQEQQDYIREMKLICYELSKHIKSQEQELLLIEELKRYKAEFLQRFKNELYSRSRIISPMISGPSNFPVARMEKQNKRHSSKLDELLEFKNIARKAILKKLNQQSIADQGGEIAVLEKKIVSAEKFQTTMKETNKIIKGKLPDAEKIAKIHQLGISIEEATKLLKPEQAHCYPGYKSYELISNLNKIKRMKERLAELQKKEFSETKKVGFNGGKIIDNKEADRIQIYFDTKPCQEMIEKLKSNGFRWSPTNGTWQRMRTDNTRRVIEMMFGVKLH